MRKEFFKLQILLKFQLKNNVHFFDSSNILRGNLFNSGYPLSYTTQIYDCNKNFTKLHDSKMFDLKHFYPTTRFGVVSKRSSGYKKVNPQRLRAILVTRFLKHGKKERALKNYAQALAYYKSVFKSISILDLYMTDIKLLYNLIHSVYRFNLSNNDVFCGTRLKVEFKNFTDDYLQSQFFYKNMFPENSEFTYFKVLLLTPVESYIINKVPKVIYKNTRGKSGRFTAKLLKISRKSAVQYSLKNIKYCWNSSKERGYLNKYIEALYFIFLRPEESITSMLFKKVKDTKKV